MKYEQGFRLGGRSSFEIVAGIAELYPEPLRTIHLGITARLAWQLDLIRRHVPWGGSAMDVGGGIGPFAPALNAAGFVTTLADDFADPVNREFPLERLPTHAGIAIVSCDAASDAFDPLPGAYDAVSCIHSIEHWHRSPKAALHKMVRALRPGGMLLIGVPNCVHLKHRFATLLGRNKWSLMEEWYERPVFRSHVREPDIEDLRYIAHDLGLKTYRIVGRNWIDYAGPFAKAADWALRLRPSLCKDLYLVARV